MKKTKIILLTAVILVVSSFFMTSVEAYEDIQQTDVFVEGKAIEFDQPAFEQRGRTLVPIRPILEALGATISWDDATQTVTSTKDGTTVRLTINDDKIYVNDRAITIDVPAQLVGGRTFVPARALAEAWGYSVTWDVDRQAVIITHRYIREHTGCFGNH